MAYDHRYGLAIVCQAQDVQSLSPTATTTDPERYMTTATYGSRRTRLWSKLAPLRAVCLSMLSLVEPKDIGTKAKSNDNDAIPSTYIASIALILTASPLTVSPFDQTILFTHSDEDVRPHSVSSTIHSQCYPNEKEMLIGFREFLMEYDPDIITGYDVCEEISEIIDRAMELGLPKNFPYLARPSSTVLRPR
jgi:hypothetical protein